MSSSTPSPASPLHAAIDIGTNSFHLVVARGMPDGGFDVITTEKEMVRLGQGSGEMKQLTPEAIDRGITALNRMAAVAASYGAEVSAVATSAVREALNRREFLDRAESEVGIAVQVISGFEEARLIHLGVLQALPVFDRRLLVVDIGGGSTEFLAGLRGEVLAARSLKLGSIRLTERFFAKASTKALSRKELRACVKACRDHVRSALAATAHELGSIGDGSGHETAIGSSGTANAIANVIAVGRGEEGASNGFTFSRAELSAWVERLTVLSPEERRSVPGLDVKRADIILGGSVLLDVIFESFNIESMTVSGYALREGVLFDRLSNADAASSGLLADLRRANALRLANQMDPDADHAETAARLAVQLFDQTAELHGYGSVARELLELAALVHNVGLFISHAAHHKHTYYVVRHSEQLTGFAEGEREIMALVARYHRKGHPALKHPEFCELTRLEQQRVRVLAGLLRVAIGLDRGHQSVVDSVAVTFRKKAKELVIQVKASDTEVDLDLEIYSAQERASLLAEALDVTVLVERCP